MEVINLEKFIYDDAIDDVLEIIRFRIEYYKNEDSLINDIIIQELESLAKEIKEQKYYK
jgi:hypothetical protein